MFEFSEWIWINEKVQNDQYADFLVEFEFDDKAILNISADSNYAVYKDGKLITFGQYADFPHDKVYDSVDISEFCEKGKNEIVITVWYIGLATTAVYCKGNAALLFEITDGRKVLAKSDDNIPSRLNPYYKNFYEKIITPQLGYSFLYDNTGNETPFSKSIAVLQKLPLRIRPCKKLSLLKPQSARLVKVLSENTFLYGFDEEQVGFLRLDVDAKEDTLITVSYGEHIADGRVRRIIGKRDFSVEFVAKKGENVYLNPFRRLGCRYIEVTSETPVCINKVQIVPTVYPLNELSKPKLSPVQSEIYDICVNTLKLCMHEHYEDCPWREQGLYTMDSRNQMLCGYYAFGEFEFARASLELISKDDRKDGLLSICYPKSEGKVIPSFSLHYVTQVLEYYNHSKDISLLKQVFPKIKSVLGVFVKRLNRGLVFPFEHSDAWNFYEWEPRLDGKKTDLSKPDLILNSLLVIALDNAQKIADIIGEKADFSETANKVRLAVNSTFYDKTEGIYVDFENENGGSILGNSLALLCGAASGMEKEIANKIAFCSSLTETSLSMLCFKYDALLKADKDKYKDYILDEIEKVFTPMVKLGNRTVWETVKGESDFQNAGSLCHGWSAMPVYYYNILED